MSSGKSGAGSNSAKDALAARLAQLERELYKKRRMLQKSEGMSAAAASALPIISAVTSTSAEAASPTINRVAKHERDAIKREQNPQPLHRSLNPVSAIDEDDFIIVAHGGFVDNSASNYNLFGVQDQDDDNDVIMHDNNHPTIPVHFSGDATVPIAQYPPSSCAFNRGSSFRHLGNPLSDLEAEFSCFACCELRSHSLSVACQGIESNNGLHSRVMCATASERFGSILVLDIEPDCVAILRAGRRVQKLQLGRCVVAKRCRTVAGRILLAVAYSQAIALMIAELDVSDNLDDIGPQWQLAGGLPWLGSEVDLIPIASNPVSGSASNIGWLVSKQEALLLNNNYSPIKRLKLICSNYVKPGAVLANDDEKQQQHHDGIGGVKIVGLEDSIAWLCCQCCRIHCCLSTDSAVSAQSVGDNTLDLVLATDDDTDSNDPPNGCLLHCEYRQADELFLCHILSADSREIMLLIASSTGRSRLIGRLNLPNNGHWRDIVCLRPGRLLAIDDRFKERAVEAASSQPVNCSLHRLDYSFIGAGTCTSVCLSNSPGWRLAAPTRLLTNRCPFQLCLLPGSAAHGNGLCLVIE